MQRILVTISDGSLGTAAGIHVLWRSLLRHRREFGREWDPVVLYPSWAWPPTQPCVDALRDHRILAIDQERDEDPYAAKLVLGNFVSTLPDATEILYLDYDHVCLSSFAPVTPSAGTVQVGSRVLALRLVGGQDGLARGSDLERRKRSSNGVLDLRTAKSKNESTS